MAHLDPPIRILRRPGDPRRGLIVADGLALPCALGRGGVSRRKREGDGATPAGILRVIRGFYRADRVRRPRTALPLRAIRVADGWCDDPAHRRYNQPVDLPFSASHERLWRDDPVYDVILELDWNRGPIRPGRGSAIFLHLARQGFTPTEGCIAVSPLGMYRLLPRLRPGVRFQIV
jgi:L,D-peptidoglycan transpeptidase YkuD (ErfK/YbiS/YcfS/YnhG family)